MPEQSLTPDWLVLAALAMLLVTMLLYMYERLSMELVSVGLVTAMLFLFSLPGAVATDGSEIGADLLLAGYGNPALLSIMALLVVGQGVFQTGAMDNLSWRLFASYERAPRRTLAATFGIVFVISAFINNTPVVVMFLPLMANMAVRMGNTPSKLLMPLSFVSILAGMTTLIGTSTNIMAADVLMRMEGQSLGFFSLTPAGLILAAVGLVYIMLAAPRLLHDREADGHIAASEAGKHFIAQLEITEDHPLIGQQAIAGMFDALPNITVRLVRRGNKTILPPFADTSLANGDIVIIAATREALTELFTRQYNLLRSMWKAEMTDKTSAAGALSLSEAMVAPGSRMVNRTVDQISFLGRHTNLVVLGVQRRSRMVRERLSDIRLEAGDTLLLCGSPEAFDTHRADHDLLLLDWSRTDLPDLSKAGTARIIALIMVLSIVSGLASIVQAAMMAACAMIVFSCLNIRQAARALDFRIFLLVGTALCMGTALEVTGAAAIIASFTIDIAAEFGYAAIVSTLFLLAAIVTNMLSNTATAVIFAPIAIESARQLGVDPTLFLLAVIYGANCAFATPISYQTNLLVMAAGHYRFIDYVRFGAPLVALLWAVFSIIGVLSYNITAAG